MAKRFTDTDKWKREWFSELNHKAKLVWFYVLDQCDHRGVWFQNFSLLSSQVGFKVSKAQFEAWFGAKVRAFEGDKYFIPSFPEFQYGELRESNNAHVSVIRLLEKLGPAEDLGSPRQGAQDKDMDKDKESVFELRAPSKNDFESVYSLYPRKVGKTAGKRTFDAQIKTPNDLEKLRLAITRYTKHVQASVSDPKFIKHFSTFMSSWRDWADDSTGSVTPGLGAMVNPLDQLRAKLQSEGRI